METSQISLLDSFKSKKSLSSSSKQSPLVETIKEEGSDRSPWSSKTPEKPANPPRRVQNRHRAMSMKKLREVAQKLQKGRDRPLRPDPISTLGENIQTQVAKSKKVDGLVKLPEKHEILVKFFDSLDSSLRLLQCKGHMTTFTKISSEIEFLSDRRFSHGHLAQLKFVLPEAIEIEKVYIYDERTSCKKPDLHITLNASAIENDKTNRGNPNLRKVFRARLLDFLKAHPEGGEVPEETLPEPFNHPKQDSHTNLTWTHLPQSFKRSFSQIIPRNETMNINQETPTVSLQPSVPSSPTKISAKAVISENCLALGSSPAPLPQSRALATPTKGIDITPNEDSSSRVTDVAQATPAKLVSTPAKLLSATPALQPPKRCYMTPDDESTSSASKLARRSGRSRSLKFDTPVKNAKAEDEVNEIGALSVDSDIFDILPENLLQSIREKERIAMEEKDPAISQAKWRKQMIAGLPKLFDTIHFLFQSIKRSVITKEELVHIVIASHLHVVDRREVGDQLRLLQELAPEWIYEKLATSGDLLLCINKISSPESIRARLAEAK